MILVPVRPPIREVAEQTTVYGIGNLLTKLAIFLLIPIYTRFLSVSDVGILALLEMMETFLATIVPFGINAALWRYLPEASGSEQKKNLIFSAFSGTVLTNLILLGALALLYRLIAPFLGLSRVDSWLLLFVILNVFLGAGFRFILGLWQYERRADRFVLLSVSQFVGVLVVTFLFVVELGWGLRGAILARTVVYGIIFVSTTSLILVSHLSIPSFKHYKILLGFGVPLIFLALVTPVLTFSDRFFMRVFLSLEDIGVYSIAYKFGMLINMILVVPLQRSWGPMMYRLGVGNESHEFHRDILFYYSVTGAMVFLAISLFSRPILGIATTEAYLSGASVIPIITLAYFFNGFRQFLMAGAALSNRTPRLAYAASAGMIVNLILNYLLIRNFGVMGAAWSTVVSYLALTVMVYAVSQSLVPIDWRWKRLASLLIIMLATFLAAFLLQSRLSSWANLWAILGTCAFPVVLWILGIIGRRELQGIKSLMKLITAGKTEA